MRILMPAAAAAATLMFCVAAIAQPVPPPPGMGGHAGGAGEQGGDWREHRHFDPAKMAAHIRTALQLRPDQDAALNAFVQALTPPEGETPGGGRGEHSDNGPRPTPEVLERHLTRERAHLAAEEKRVEATKRFYATLTPAQQKAFDELHAAMGRHMMGHPPLGGEHGPMGPPPEPR